MKNFFHVEKVLIEIGQGRPSVMDSSSPAREAALSFLSCSSSTRFSSFRCCCRGGHVCRRSHQRLGHDPAHRVFRRLHPHQMRQGRDDVDLLGIREPPTGLDAGTSDHERHRPGILRERWMAAFDGLSVVAGHEDQCAVVHAELLQFLDERAQVRIGFGQRLPIRRVAQPRCRAGCGHPSLRCPADARACTPASSAAAPSASRTCSRHRRRACRRGRRETRCRPPGT